jgi:predicted dithiol-disulfide oxidoreductase (DUF899 family)
MSYADTMAVLNAKRAEITAIRAQMRELQGAVGPQEVMNYVLAGWNGPVRLSELFGPKRDLIVIHNMGVGCPACTMWADGFNGVYDHLASRAAFVVASPNPVDVQKAFAAERGWRFPMVSHAGTSFAEDLGYRRPGQGADRHGGWWPGVSVFRREGDKVVRVSDTELGPMDSFCVVYHLFELVPDSDPNWEPSYKYPQQGRAA